MSDDIQQRIQDDEEFREAIFTWLRANGLEPNQIPAGVRPSIAEGEITIETFVVNTEGQFQRDTEDPNTLARKTVTVPLKVPPTPEVDLWRRPRCPACGR